MPRRAGRSAAGSGRAPGKVGRAGAGGCGGEGGHGHPPRSSRGALGAGSAPRRHAEPGECPRSPRGGGLRPGAERRPAGRERGLGAGERASAGPEPRRWGGPAGPSPARRRRPWRVSLRRTREAAACGKLAGARSPAPRGGPSRPAALVSNYRAGRPERRCPCCTLNLLSRE